MQLEGYVEIGQDGVGIIELKAEAKGLFTYKIESCLIAIFKCMKATILIHDSGQLKLTQIEKIVKKYGSITKVTFIHRKVYDGRHNERMKKIIKMAGAKHEVLMASIEPFAVACSKLGTITVLPHVFPEGVIPLPDAEKRQAVCEINNAFMQEGSQNLTPDVQYVNGEFCAPRMVDKPLPALLEMVKTQPKFFFMNLAVLGNVTCSPI